MIKTRVFKSGNSMAVRLPKEFAMGEGDVYITRVGDFIILRETSNPTEALRQALTLFTNDFMSGGREQPSNPGNWSFDMAADDEIKYDVGTSDDPDCR